MLEITKKKGLETLIASRRINKIYSQEFDLKFLDYVKPVNKRTLPQNDNTFCKNKDITPFHFSLSNSYMEQSTN